MNTRRLGSGLLACTIAIAGSLLWSGCDTDSADSPITVTPNSATLTPGHSQQFTASGGYEYTWSLDPNDGSGKLNTTKGETVVYTCLSTNIGTMPKTINVASTITGSSSGTTSSASADR